MKLTFLGHSTVHVDTGEYKFIIDPFLSGNPLATASAEDIEVDYVLLTHGHSDHIGDAELIARRNNATIVGIVELANYFEHLGLNTIGMNLGGSFRLPIGMIKFTPALHSSSITKDGINLYLGVAAGIIIQLDQITLYHAGDTALFSDLKLIGEQHPIDVAMIPIGNYFTMGPDDALIAAQWLQAKITVPVHYNTFPPIEQNGDEFAIRLKQAGLTGQALKPGESIDLTRLK
ncbi:metal-dependent hydrolase [compost metagenome]